MRARLPWQRLRIAAARLAPPTFSRCAGFLPGRYLPAARVPMGCLVVIDALVREIRSSSGTRFLLSAFLGSSSRGRGTRNHSGLYQRRLRRRRNLLGRLLDVPGWLPSCSSALRQQLVQHKLNTTGAALVCSTRLGGAQDAELQGCSMGTVTDIRCRRCRQRLCDRIYHFDRFPYGPGRPDHFRACSWASRCLCDEAERHWDSALYSTYLGGRYHDEAGAISLDSRGNTPCHRSTVSPDFPTTRARFPGRLRTEESMEVPRDETGCRRTALVNSTWLDDTGWGDDIAVGSCLAMPDVTGWADATSPDSGCHPA